MKNHFVRQPLFIAVRAYVTADRAVVFFTGVIFGKKDEIYYNL